MTITRVFVFSADDPRARDVATSARRFPGCQWRVGIKSKAVTNLLWDHEFSVGTFKYCSGGCWTGKQATAKLSLGTDNERIDPNGSSGNNVLPVYNSLNALRTYNERIGSTLEMRMYTTRYTNPCSESVNIKNGFGVGQEDVGLGLRVVPCAPLSGHCGGKSSAASVSCDSAVLNPVKQLQIQGVFATFSVETAKSNAADTI